MLRVAVTGGIASGKTTVVGLLANWGSRVLSADRIAREVVRPGAAGWQRVRQAFGPQVFTAAGELDRARLAARVFADPAARQQLEQLLHPLIMQTLWHRLAVLQLNGRVPVVVVEVPLLFECGLQDRFDCAVLVWTSRARQERWLRVRSGLSTAEVAQRLGAQMPLDDKRARADYIIDNTADVAALSSAVARLWPQLWCRACG